MWQIIIKWKPYSPQLHCSQPCAKIALSDPSLLGIGNVVTNPPATYAVKIPNVGPISTIDQAAPPEYVEIMALERGFQEISVTRLGFQTAAQRVSISEHFGQSAKLLRALGFFSRRLLI
jgi:hypothetical protein